MLSGTNQLTIPWLVALAVVGITLGGVGAVGGLVPCSAQVDGGGGSVEGPSASTNSTGANVNGGSADIDGPNATAGCEPPDDDPTDEVPDSGNATDT